MVVKVGHGVQIQIYVCVFALKVEMTWDETDHERVTTLNRKFKKDEILDMDFQAYLASSSEDDEEEDEDLEGLHQIVYPNGTFQ